MELILKDNKCVQAFFFLSTNSIKFERRINCVGANARTHDSFKLSCFTLCVIVVILVYPKQSKHWMMLVYSPFFDHFSTAVCGFILFRPNVPDLNISQNSSS